MQAFPNEPIYLIDKTSPIIEQYRNVFEAFEKDPSLHTLNMDIAPRMVQERQTGCITEMFIALQHSPHLIEQFLFVCDFKFPQIADSELYFQEQDWKSDAAYYRWFHKLGESFPVMLFFIKDHESRFYSIAGDLYADGKYESKHEEGKKNMLIYFEDKELQTICDRIFHACWFFHIFCHGSGFDPQSAIESVIADLNMPVSYENVREKYENDIRTGIHLKVVKSTDEGDSIL